MKKKIINIIYIIHTSLFILTQQYCLRFRTAFHLFCANL